MQVTIEILRISFFIFCNVIWNRISKKALFEFLSPFIFGARDSILKICYCLRFSRNKECAPEDASKIVTACFNVLFTSPYIFFKFVIYIFFFLFALVEKWPQALYRFGSCSKSSYSFPMLEFPLWYSR